MNAETVDWSSLPVYLETWRQYRNMTQRELAERAGLAVTTINEIETAKRKARPSTLRRLASALGIEYWNLYNPPGFGPGLMQEAVQAFQLLAKVARENAINGSTGRDSVTELARSFDDACQLEELHADALDVIQFAVPAALGLRAWSSAALTHEEVLLELDMLDSALLYRVREWTELGTPRDVAEAFLRADLEEIQKVALGHASGTGSLDEALADPVRVTKRGEE